MTTPSAADGARPATDGPGGRPESPAPPAQRPTGQPGRGDRPPRHDGADAQPLLRLRDIGKNFGPVRALSDINLDDPGRPGDRARR